MLENIWKFKSIIEKCKILHIESKNIKVEYKSSKKDMKKLTGECDLSVVLIVHFKLTIIFSLL